MSVFQEDVSHDDIWMHPKIPLPRFKACSGDVLRVTMQRNFDICTLWMTACLLRIRL